MSSRKTAVIPLALSLLLSARAQQERAILFAASATPMSDTTTVAVFSMQPDGSARRQLSPADSRRKSSSFPVWSPDGEYIAYHVTMRNPRERMAIHVMDKNGANDRIVARFDSADALIPEWSPDGARLLFQVNPNTSRQDSISIYTVLRDGTGLARVPLPAGAYGSPTWEPGGLTILTEHRQPGGRTAILRMTVATGQSRVIVASDSLVLSGPMVSPDGSAIVMQGAIRGPPLTVHIFSMNPDGTGLRQLTRAAGIQNYPRWSHDGRHIIMQCNPEDPNVRRPGQTWFDTFEVCIVAPDGTNFRRLTRNASADIHPSW